MLLELILGTDYIIFNLCSVVQFWTDRPLWPLTLWAHWPHFLVSSFSHTCTFQPCHRRHHFKPPLVNSPQQNKLTYTLMTLTTIFPVTWVLHSLWNITGGLVFYHSDYLHLTLTFKPTEWNRCVKLGLSFNTNAWDTFTAEF